MVSTHIILAQLEEPLEEMHLHLKKRLNQLLSWYQPYQYLLTLELTEKYDSLVQIKPEMIELVIDSFLANLDNARLEDIWVIWLYLRNKSYFCWQQARLNGNPIANLLLDQKGLIWYLEKYEYP